MLERTLRDLRCRCDVARSRRPSRQVLIESSVLNELLTVYEAAHAVGQDSTDEAFERLMNAIPTRKKG